MFSYKMTIGQDEISNAYKHVHHAHSLKFLEIARVKLLEAAGYPLEGFLQQGLFLVVSAISVKYLRELFAGPVTVTCENLREDKKKFILEQNILNPKGKVAISAQVELMCLSGELKRAIAVDPQFISALKSKTSS